MYCTTHVGYIFHVIPLALLVYSCNPCNRHWAHFQPVGPLNVGYEPTSQHLRSSELCSNCPPCPPSRGRREPQPSPAIPARAFRSSEKHSGAQNRGAHCFGTLEMSAPPLRGGEGWLRPWRCFLKLCVENNTIKLKRVFVPP